MTAEPPLATPYGRFHAPADDQITRQLQAFGAHTRNELAMVLDHLAPGETAVDFGAHIGSFAVPMARKLGPQGRVLAVEAAPEAFALLARNVGLNGLAHRIATVRAIAGEGTEPPLRRVEEAANSGAGHFRPEPGGLARATNAWSLLCGRGFARADFVKLDVEGMETQVLRALAPLLGARRPKLYVEISAAQLARFGSHPAEIEALLRPLGYRFFRNAGARNSPHDRYVKTELGALAEGGAFFDLLALPDPARPAAPPVSKPARLGYDGPSPGAEPASMKPEDARQFVGYAYEIAFRRAPSDKEMDMYAGKLAGGEISATQFLRMCIGAHEFRVRNSVRSIFPMGHYHSPVVDPSTVADYLKRENALTLEDLKGVSVDVPAMRALWRKHLDFTRAHRFSETANGSERFRYGDGPFPEGDAMSLQLMIAEHRPKRVIEIGSGFSTACMLDAFERLGLEGVEVTCVEPYPERLQSLLRPTDRVELIQKPVQEVEGALIDKLQPDDMLFIDSTHVMKTGSDVHYEFFHLLPRVKPGVVVHVHDVGFPFEYPDKWVFEFNYSWNEAYALRAFLMYNDAFAITYWNSLLYREPDVREEAELKSGNPGSSIWLRRAR